MNCEAIIEAAKAMEEIVYETLFTKHCNVNINGEKIKRFEYDGVPADEAEADVKKIADLLKKYLSGTDEDTFGLIFAEACNCCCKYSLSTKLDAPAILSELAACAGGGSYAAFLTHLGEAIFALAAGEYEKFEDLIDRAEELYPDQSVIKLYSFIIYAERYFLICKDDPEEKKLSEDLMLYCFSAMPPALRNHAVRKENCLIAPSQEDSDISSSLLPYIHFISDDEELMRSIRSDLSLMKNSSRGKISKDTFFLEEFRKRALTGTRNSNEQLSYAFISDRLSYIYDTLSEPEYKDDCIPFCSNNGIFGRTRNLWCPAEISKTDAFSFSELVPVLLEKDAALRERDQAIADKERILDRFVHRYSQLSSEALREIADVLFNCSCGEKNQEYGKNALIEYELKSELAGAVTLLNLQFRRDAEGIRRLMREGVCGNHEHSVGVADIIGKAMKFTLIKVLYMFQEKNPKSIQALKQIGGICGSIKELQERFIKAVIVDDSSAFEWFCENVVNIALNISDEWQQLRFYKDSDCAQVLCDHFSELFFNFIKYGDLKYPMELSLSFSNDCYVIKAENAVCSNAGDFSGKGLDSARDLFELINADASGQTMVQTVSENRFSIRTQIAGDVFKEDKFHE